MTRRPLPLPCPALNSALHLAVRLILTLLMPAIAAADVHGQSVAPSPVSASSSRMWAPPPRVVVPQIGRVAGTSSAIEITDIKAHVTIRDTIAVTTIELALANRSNSAQEATLVVPVPPAATVGGFTFEGPSRESTARILSRDEARREYDAIVARERDPALLEWAGWNLVRTSVFPVPARGTQKIHLEWEELLVPTGDRLDYVLPRSDLQYGGPIWAIDIDVTSTTPIAGLYSPTHEVRTVHVDERTARLSMTDRGAAASGSLRLSVVRSAAPSATVITYPDPSIGGGYFLMLAAAPESAESTGLLRDVVLVLDRSGSMSGAPLEQAKIAASRIVDGLRAGERINVIDFSNGVSRYASEPVPIDPTVREDVKRYLAGLRPAGGTNLHDALVEAMRQSAAPGSLPLCLFLTDGIPTIGKTLESDISAVANVSQRRVFTVGIGPDVNVPLLDRIADGSRAIATYVTPGDDLTAKVTDIAMRFADPVIAAMTLSAAEGGRDAPGRIAETLPSILPDLFRGSSLVVLGQYRGELPFSLTVAGDARDGRRRLVVEVDPRKASTSNSFVPRLWASRRIAQLIDAVRQSPNVAASRPITDLADARMRELVGEIVRLSTTWGILTEYTSMLALEGSTFNDWKALETACSDSLNGRAVRTRSGYDAVNQGINWNRQKAESNLAGTKQYIDSALTNVQSQSLTQCGDKNFWRQGQRWNDASLAGQAAPTIDEEISFGSERHRQLLWELVEDGRQSAIALDGEVLLRHRSKTYLVHNRVSGVTTP